MQTVQHTLPCPPYGGRVTTIDCEVPAFASFEQAAIKAGPQTSPDSSVWSARAVYRRPVHPGPRQFILMWAGTDSRTASNEAIAWCRSNALEVTSPYEVFALCAQYPRLYERCKRTKGCGFVATETALLSAMGRIVCGVWQSAKGHARSSLIDAEAKFYDKTIFVFKPRQ